MITIFRHFSTHLLANHTQKLENHYKIKFPKINARTKSNNLNIFKRHANK